MRRVEHITQEDNTIGILYNDSSTGRKPYTVDNYRSLLKDAIIYHKERIKYHEREGNRYLKQLRGGTK